MAPVNMPLYWITALGNYGGGACVIAAPTANEALVLARGIKDEIWKVDYGNPEDMKQVGLTYGPARVVARYETGE